MKIIRSQVIAGEGWGTLVGFPTANLKWPAGGHKKIGRGVYAGWVTIGREPRRHRGLIIGGVKSFFRSGAPKLEIYILDFKKNIVGQSIRAELVEKIRDIKKFKNTQALIRQIQQDIKEAKLILK